MNNLYELNERLKYYNAVITSNVIRFIMCIISICIFNYLQNDFLTSISFLLSILFSILIIRSNFDRNDIIKKINKIEML